jgi:hypothetical protein
MATRINTPFGSLHLPPRIAPSRSRPRWRPADHELVLGFALLAVALRLPFVTTPLLIDEAGYAYVAQHWSSGSGGIYGSQWVDRPPLLIALYAAAMFAFGEFGVRLLGMLAMAATVACCAAVAGRLGGREALVGAGIAAVAMTASPQFQGQGVNSEVPAIAFVSISIWCAVRALHDGRHVARFGFGAGLAASAAVLVKQSFVDGLAFGAVLLVAGALLGRALPHDERAVLRARLVRLAAGGIAGVTLATIVLVTWAIVWGPGIGALLDALYGFRIDARAAIESHGEQPQERRVLLLLVAIGSGILLLSAAVTFALTRIATRDRTAATLEHTILRIVAWGTLLGILWSWLAVTQGGNWWLHYLLQPVPFLSIGAGLAWGAAPRLPWTARIALGLVVASAAVAWTTTATRRVEVNSAHPAEVVGSWVGDAADPDDTVFVTWGHANVVLATGLRTPYDTLWSLPLRVRDPGGERVRSLLDSDAAPVWLVRWTSFRAFGLDAGDRLTDIVRRRYELVARPCGHKVYRRRDVPSKPLPPMPDAATCGIGAATEDLDDEVSKRVASIATAIA